MKYQPTEETKRFAVACCDLFGVWSWAGSAKHSSRIEARELAHFIRCEYITGDRFSSTYGRITDVRVVDADRAPMVFR